MRSTNAMIPHRAVTRNTQAQPHGMAYIHDNTSNWSPSSRVRARKARLTDYQRELEQSKAADSKAVTCAPRCQNTIYWRRGRGSECQSSHRNGGAPVPPLHYREAGAAPRLIPVKMPHYAVCHTTIA
ncbi:ribose phosphate diphosphokinase subunit prs4 [Hypoxylon texense]